jgi:site-specific recombinase XerC
MKTGKRGRKRKFQPGMPSHIEQSAIPTGLYWNNKGAGSWRVAEINLEGKREFVTVAGRSAMLSDLNAIMEQRAGKAARGTVQHVSDAFMESTEWAELSEATKRDYRIHAKIACDTVTRAGIFGSFPVGRLNTSFVQKLIESITAGKLESKPGAGDGVAPRPSTANHVLRYLRRLFAWGVRMGECQKNPADGCRQSTERKKNTMPADEAFRRVLHFARVRGARKARTAGSLPPYLAPAMSLAFRLRMRGIELTRLSEADATDEGIVVKRVKGSRDNVVKWTPTLRAAWDEALAARARTLSAKANATRPTPIRPEHRPIFVSADGGRLGKGALDQAMQALMELAIKDGAITAEDRFSLHGLKHLGITKTKGNRADKQQASGHKTAAMMDVYDHELPVVDEAQMDGLDPTIEAELCTDLCTTKEKGT